MSGTRVLDELLCFLGDVIFQVPVRTFMDNRCFLFDPSIDITDEHKQIHAEYKSLIDTLLESYCEDSDITLNDVLSGIKEMSNIPDIKEVFQVVFEQVWAADDFKMFVHIMCRRNLAIQELAMKLLMQATGMAPETLQMKQEPSKPSTSSAGMSTERSEDEELLKRALLESKREDEKVKQRQQQEEKDLARTLELSKQETAKVQEQQKALEKSIQNMTLAESLPPVPGLSSKPAVPSASFSSPAKPMPSQPAPSAFSAGAQSGFGVTKGGPSGAEAANNWLKSAMEVSQESDTHRAVMAQMQRIDTDELKRRQEFLRIQREKLLKMKQEDREKQLNTAVKANPARPSSARAARAAMANKGSMPAATSQATSEEEEKRMAMRKAIADKLRMEMLSKPL